MVQSQLQKTKMTRRKSNDSTTKAMLAFSGENPATDRNSQKKKR
jgi:hypothetical protein